MLLAIPSVSGRPPESYGGGCVRGLQMGGLGRLLHLERASELDRRAGGGHGRKGAWRAASPAARFTLASRWPCTAGAHTRALPLAHAEPYLCNVLALTNPRSSAFYAGLGQRALGPALLTHS